MEYIDSTATVSVRVQRVQLDLRMLRFGIFAAICFLLTFGSFQLFADAAIVTPTTPTIVPTPNPFDFSRINNPYYNNPYYKNNPYYNNNQYYNNRYNNNNPYYNNLYNQYGVGPTVPILSYSSENAGDGNYAFSFTTGDGKQAQENGFLKDAYIDNVGNPQGTQVVQGSFAYVSPEGTPVQVSYVADEKGFRPSGPQIPADGSAPTLPVPVNGDNRLYNSAYNRYNPYYSFNNYYRGSNSPYDSRFPYDSSRYNPYYNNYNPFSSVAQNNGAKKSTS